MLADRAERLPEGELFQFRDAAAGKFKSLNARQALELVKTIGLGLLRLGIRRGAPVAIISHTRIEWTLLDLAILAVGGITVPIYETSSKEQIDFILSDAKVEFFFAETPEIAEKFASAGIAGRIIEDGAIEELTALAEGGDLGEIDRIQSQLSGEDTATIVYTSGSTGRPKGVILQNKAYVSIALDTQIALPEIVRAPYTRLLLFLPLAHGFARFCQFALIASEGAICLTSSIKTLLDDMREVQPSVLLGVPRIFEKVFNASSHKAGSGAAKLVFTRATKAATEWSKIKELGKVPLQVELKRQGYDRLVYAQIRKALGGKARFAICGGAPLNAEISHFFRGAGVEILEGYGMTETVAPICVNRPGFNRIGSIGVPFPGVEMRIAPDSELILNAPYQFAGYNNDPKATSETLVSEPEEFISTTGAVAKYSPRWVATGDLAAIDEDGFVKITGRKKELIVTAGGKNISPGPLEALIDAAALVANSVVIGDQKPFVGALVTLDLEETNRWGERLGHQPFASRAEASANPAVRAEIWRAIERANESVSRAESIRKFAILPAEFTETAGTLTPSLKIRRARILETFTEYVDEVYS